MMNLDSEIKLFIFNFLKKKQKKENYGSTSVMILHITNPKDSTRKHLYLINTFSNVAGYKSNTQKLVDFLYVLYIKDKPSKKEIRATVPFTTAKN